MLALDGNRPQGDRFFNQQLWTSNCTEAVLLTSNKSLSERYPLETVFVDIGKSTDANNALWLKTVASIEHFYKERL